MRLNNDSQTDGEKLPAFYPRTWLTILIHFALSLYSKIPKLYRHRSKFGSSNTAIVAINFVDNMILVIYAKEFEYPKMIFKNHIIWKIFLKSSIMIIWLLYSFE
jgi:hypothetical protein